MPRLLLALAAAGLGLNADAAATNYLIVSAPRNSRVSYLKISASGEHSGTPQVLIDSGLRHPLGVAVDTKRKKLFVADPDVRKIFAYNLVVNSDTLSTDGQQFIVSENSESRWVAVDGAGNVYFTNEGENQILKVSAQRVLRGDPTPTVVYNGASVPQVSRPGGIAVDNFNVFWTNKLSGEQVGSIVMGAELPPNPNSAEDYVNILARNTARAYGVCISLNNIYYTDTDHYIYGIKKSGGAIATVNSRLQQPRGCAWDGDGTVFVADKVGNAIYSFAGNMHAVGPVHLTKVVDYEDAFGLAVVNAAWPRAAAPACAALAALLTAWMVR